MEDRRPGPAQRPHGAASGVIRAQIGRLKDTIALQQRLVERLESIAHRVESRGPVDTDDFLWAIQLNAASRIEDLRMPPSNRLEALKADRAGQWSIRVNDRWRVCFRFDNGDAYDVEIVDYHH